MKSHFWINVLNSTSVRKDADCCWQGENFSTHIRRCYLHSRGSYIVRKMYIAEFILYSIWYYVDVYILKVLLPWIWQIEIRIWRHPWSDLTVSSFPFVDSAASAIPVSVTAFLFFFEDLMDRCFVGAIINKTNIL